MRGSQWAFCASLPYLIRTGPSMLSPKGTMRGVPASAHSCSKMNFCTDRKSTRLNSSHLVISYAVFCLKKKKNKMIDLRPQFAIFPARDRLAFATAPCHPYLSYLRLVHGVEYLDVRSGCKSDVSVYSVE